jgi:hypothetical protein
MRTRFLVIVLIALAVGLAAGYFYRRSRAPTLEERARDAAEDVRRGFDKLVK